MEKPTIMMMGHYRKDFDINSREAGSRLRVFIEYADPAGFVGRALGALLGPMYARWRVRRIADDAGRAAASA